MSIPKKMKTNYASILNLMLYSFHCLRARPGRILPSSWHSNSSAKDTLNSPSPEVPGTADHQGKNPCKHRASLKPSRLGPSLNFRTRRKAVRGQLERLVGIFSVARDSAQFLRSFGYFVLRSLSSLPGPSSFGLCSLQNFSWLLVFRPES